MTSEVLVLLILFGIALTVMVMIAAMLGWVLRQSGKASRVPYAWCNACGECNQVAASSCASCGSRDLTVAPLSAAEPFSKIQSSRLKAQQDAAAEQRRREAAAAQDSVIRDRQRQEEERRLAPLYDWEQKIQLLALTCDRCGGLALPLPTTENRYGCPTCNHRFKGARHDVPMRPAI
jgi:uncharacterized OB-fold protein